MIPEEELRQMYWDNGMTQSDIADEVGVNNVTVSKWMKVYGIELRTLSEAKLGNSVKPSKEYMEEMYWGRDMSQARIAKEIGVSYGTIFRWMKEYEIESRTISESRLGKYDGENNPNWCGGTSFEPYCDKFNVRFKEAVRERDDYTCQLCGFKQNGRKLSIHHIHYDKSNCYPDVVVLCNSCNSRVNFDRDYWEHYFELQLAERGMMGWSI